MKDTIFYVGGSKGGVGKSMVALTLVQFLIDKYGDGKTIHLIETDESNPDVGRVYRGQIPVSNVMLDDKENGWILLSNIIESSSNSLFVINSAARSNMGVAKHGVNFSAILAEAAIPYDFVTFFPINRQKDSVLLLCDYLKAMTFGNVYVVLNTYFGNPEQFGLFAKYYDSVPILQQRVSDILDFPELSDILADEFYTGGKTIPETISNLGAFARQSFKSWREKVYKMFEKTGIFTNGSTQEQEVIHRKSKKTDTETTDQSEEHQ